MTNYRMIATATTAKLTKWVEGDATIEFGWDDGHKQGALFRRLVRAEECLERIGLGPVS